MSLDVTSIVSMHGQVYKDSGQGVKDLLRVFYQKSKTDMYFNVTPTTETVKHAGKVTTDRVLQLFQKGWTPLGGTAVEAFEKTLTKLKIEDGVEPDDLEDTWLGFMATLDDNDRTKWPFIKWLLENHVLPRSISDWERYEVYKGISASVTTPGTPNAVYKNFVGIGKQINDYITAGKIDISATMTGAWSNDAKTFVEQVEAWVAACKERSEDDRIIWEDGEIDRIFMSPSRRDLFKEGMGIKYNTNYKQIELNPNVNVDDTVTVHNSNVIVTGLPSMIGKDKIFATPSWNRWGAIKRPKSSKLFHVFQNGTNPREVNWLADFWKGLGFWDPSAIYTNDLELS